MRTKDRDREKKVQKTTISGKIPIKYHPPMRVVTAKRAQLLLLLEIHTTHRRQRIIDNIDNKCSVSERDSK